MAYSDSTYSDYFYRRRGRRDTRVTAVWPRVQADAYFLLCIATACVEIGVFAEFIVIQQRMQLGIPWLFPYAITVGAITVVIIAIVALLSRTGALTPLLLTFLSFILFVLYLTGMIETAILLFGEGNVSGTCGSMPSIRGVSQATLAWLEQDSICAQWYAAFSFWLIGILCFVFLWLLSVQVHYRLRR